MINLFVCHINDGGDIGIDYDDEKGFWNSFLCENQGDIEWCERDLESGLSELESYFTVDGSVERNEKDVKEFEEKKKEFLKSIEGKKGKFYMWGVEYDCDLCFIEEGEGLEYTEEDEDENCVVMFNE